MKNLFPFLFVIFSAGFCWILISLVASFAYLDFKYFSVFEWHSGGRIFYSVMVLIIIFGVISWEIEESRWKK